MSRPELGELNVGDTVYVVERLHRSTDEIEATVTKVARVWVDLRAVDSSREWRMRLDDQTDGSQHSYSASFHTREQLEYRQRLSEACDYLHKQGIRLDFTSPWRTDEGQVRLAELLRKENER